MVSVAAENIAYYKGDNLFDVAWVGPVFDPHEPDYGVKMAALRRVFQGHNVVAELIGNWKDGLIAQPFNWYLKDSSGDRADASDAEIQLQRWIDWVEQQSLELDPNSTNFQQCDPWSEFVLSLGVCGEASLRLWQPARFADDADPIRRIHLHAPKAGAVMVQRGLDGFVDSLSYNCATGMETQTLLDNRLLSISIQGQNEPEVFEIDTGGRWLIQRLQMPSLLTPSAKQKQSAICHALTMALRNNQLSGFRERTLLNAAFPFDESGDAIAVPRGPGLDQYLYGIQQQSADGMVSYANPSVFESQPVEVRTFSESVQLNRILLYLEFRQGHLLSDNDGGISGESRLQQRQGFELYLRGWRRPIESAIANTLNIVLRLLGYQELEAVVELKISTGRLSSGELKVIREQYQAGLLSKATAIALSGLVDDVDGELALLQEEQDSQIEPPQFNPADFVPQLQMQTQEQDQTIQGDEIVA